jgi:hypothetical protein
MFFVAKATLCIGLVAVVASQAGGSPGAGLDADTRAAAASLGRACLASSDCLRVGAGVLAAASGGAVAAPELRIPHPRAAAPMAGTRRASDGARGRDATDRTARRAAAQG